jgi:FKBP-type peptidyl-prolyl cis-trans isomerase SlyD
MQLLADDPQGNTVPLWVVEVENDRYVLDGNHPLAGITLHFDITVKQVRPATEAELEALQTQGQDE